MFVLKVLKFEVCGLRLNLRFEVWDWIWGLKFDIEEVKVWSWSLRLASEIKTGGWVLNIKHAVKD